MKRFTYILILLLYLLGISSIATAAASSELAIKSNHVDFYNEEYDFYEHEERPHIPSPSRQADVAVGVGISTIGIVLVNSLTKTSLFGSASFNSTFNPSSPSPASVPTGGAATASGAGTTGAGTAASGSAGNGIVGVIKEFFKGLFDNLRDMLTDEGRSYASGKFSDILETTEIDDISDNR